MHSLQRWRYRVNYLVSGISASGKWPNKVLYSSVGEATVRLNDSIRVMLCRTLLITSVVKLTKQQSTLFAAVVKVKRRKN